MRSSIPATKLASLAVASSWADPAGVSPRGDDSPDTKVGLGGAAGGTAAGVSEVGGATVPGLGAERCMVWMRVRRA